MLALKKMSKFPIDRKKWFLYPLLLLAFMLLLREASFLGTHFH